MGVAASWCRGCLTAREVGALCKIDGIMRNIGENDVIIQTTGSGSLNNEIREFAKINPINAKFIWPKETFPNQF